MLYGTNYSFTRPLKTYIISSIVQQRPQNLLNRISVVAVLVLTFIDVIPQPFCVPFQRIHNNNGNYINENDMNAICITG